MAKQSIDKHTLIERTATTFGDFRMLPCVVSASALYAVVRMDAV